MRVASLNLNGIRAANRKGLAAWMSALQADKLLVGVGEEHRLTANFVSRNGGLAIG